LGLYLWFNMERRYWFDPQWPTKTCLDVVNGLFIKAAIIPAWAF
jgi:hypothetical protein